MMASFQHMRVLFCIVRQDLRKENRGIGLCLLGLVAFVFLLGGPALTFPWFWNRGGCFRQAVIGVLVGGLFVVVTDLVGLIALGTVQ
jgi:hypothetical protein